MEMPWVKHEGEELSEVSSDYLWWVIENADNVKKDLAEAIEAELEEREA